MARDRYLPRQFMNQGDRLAFSNGIVGLSVFAALLIVALRRRHPRADPALHDRRLHLVHPVADGHGPAGEAQRHAQLAPGEAAISLIGALLTGTVLVIVAVTKVSEGAWIILLLIPCLVFVFIQTKKHYDHVAASSR